VKEVMALRWEIGPLGGALLRFTAPVSICALVLQWHSRYAPLSMCGFSVCPLRFSAQVALSQSGHSRMSAPLPWERQQFCWKCGVLPDGLDDVASGPR